MKLIRLIKIFGLLIIFSLNVSCEKNNDVIIVIQNENHKNFLLNYILHNGYNVEIIDNGNNLTMKNTTMEMWLDILNILKQKMNIISTNIANVNTTQTDKGGAYIRQVFSFTVENGFEIIDDIHSEKRFVYDPQHPDAIKNGEKQGFVEYSNIDIMAETVLLIEVNTLYESIANYLRNNYKNVIF